MDQRPTLPDVPSEIIKTRARKAAAQRQQNRVVALALVCVAVSILFVVVTLVVMLRVPEFRHALATL